MLEASGRAEKEQKGDKYIYLYLYSVNNLTETIYIELKCTYTLLWVPSSPVSQGRALAAFAVPGGDLYAFTGMTGQTEDPRGIRRGRGNRGTLRWCRRHEG